MFKHLLWQYSSASIPATKTVDLIANGNITLSGTITIDGTVSQVGWLVLAVAQTVPSQNGLYTVSAGAWSRATGYNTNGDWRGGLNFYVQRGASNRGKVSLYLPTLNANKIPETPTLGTTDLVLTKTNTAGYTVNNTIYDWLGKVQGLVSSSSKITLYIPVFRELDMFKNLSVSGRFAEFSAITNRVDISLMQIDQKWGYLHLINPPKDTDAYNLISLSSELSTVTITPSATPANPVSFSFALPAYLKGSTYCFRIELYDTIGADTLASFTSEAFITGEYK